MIRFDFMPSDYNPLFLFLGDADDMAALARTLRGFAQHPKVTDLGDALMPTVSKSRVALVPEQGEAGAYGLTQDGDGSFRWGLNAWQAEQIAARIDVLTPAENRSGSDIFELGIEGEIPVKVSRGEFEDDFLVRKF
ncbi:MAG: hypothetical protein INR70_43655 [Parafilimonas terrae]|nr:hypothetical protein [Parafilimonas terrae]